MSALLFPLLLAAGGLFALLRGTDVFSAMTRGAAQGLKTVGRIFPALLVLMTAVSMLRASGAVEALAGLLSPVLDALGLPGETVPLMLLRPFSGSGALAAGTELINRVGPDSYPGRVAAVMLGSTETTFYVLSVYLGAAGVKRLPRAVPAALAADLVGFLAAALTVRLFFQTGPVLP